MKDFEKAICRTLKNEGGYVNNPNDPGGETKYGISKRQYPLENIKDLTKERAKEIYYQDYWLPLIALMNLDKSYDKFQAMITPIIIKLFDISVNMGLSKATKIFQRGLRVAYPFHPIVDDGIYGDLTKDMFFDFLDIALNSKCMIHYLLVALRCEQAGVYREIVARDPTQNIFLDGWLKRAYT